MRVTQTLQLGMARELLLVKGLALLLEGAQKGRLAMARELRLARVQELRLEVAVVRQSSQVEEVGRLQELGLQQLALEVLLELGWGMATQRPGRETLQQVACLELAQMLQAMALPLVMWVLELALVLPWLGL